jgi:hypothetical protein
MNTIMRRGTLWAIGANLVAATAQRASADSALFVLGKDFTFPNRIDERPYSRSAICRDPGKR